MLIDYELHVLLYENEERSYDYLNKVIIIFSKCLKIIFFVNNTKPVNLTSIIYLWVKKWYTVNVTDSVK